MKLALVALGLVLVCGGAAAAGHEGEECKANYQQCEEHVKELMLDNDAFWFGNSYARRCPVPTRSLSDPNAEPWCLNPLPGSLSLYSRLLGQQSEGFVPLSSDFQSSLDNLRLANVTWPNLWQQPGYGCGHYYQIPYRANVTVNPLEVTRVSQQQIYELPPVVTWPASPSQMFTVFLYDVGYFYLHALYINCMGGNMEQCTEVVRYNGPMNADLTPNPYVVLVAEQTESLDYMTIMDKVKEHRTDEYSTFRLTDFQNGINFKALTAATVIQVAGDLFGAQGVKDFGPIDMCPFHVSQTEFMHQALVDQANMGDMFTSATDWFPDGHRPFLPHLEVVIKPTFMAEEIEFESCCKHYHYPGSMMIPDPFSKIPERPVQTRNKPHVELSAIEKMNMTLIRDTTYMMMLVDFGDLKASWDGMDKSFMVHWFVSNIRWGSVMYAKEEIRYFGPNPFQRDQPRMYAFLLFEQKDPKFDPESTIMNYVDGNCMNPSTSRCKYYLKRMIQDWNLGPIRGVNYFWSVQDEFARMRIYNEWEAGSKSMACTGIPGYMDMICPLTCWDLEKLEDMPGIADHAHMATASHASIWMAAIFTIVLFFKM